MDSFKVNHKFGNGTNSLMKECKDFIDTVVPCDAATAQGISTMKRILNNGS